MKKKILVILSLYMLTIYTLISCAYSIIPSEADTTAAQSQQDPYQDDSSSSKQSRVGFDDFNLDEVDLSELPTDLKTTAFLFEDGLNLIASIPEANIALYAPLDDEFSGVLLKRDDKLYKFDWSFSYSLLRVAWEDFDNDEDNELAVAICTMQGPQLFHEDLHIIEFAQDGTVDDHLIPTRLYQEDLHQKLHCELDTEKNYVTIRMGEDGAISFTPQQRLPESLDEEDGIDLIYNLVSYNFEDDRIIGLYGLSISCREWIGYGYREDRASIKADVTWDGNQFELGSFSLNVSVK